jgi:hypothetical protein
MCDFKDPLCKDPFNPVTIEAQTKEIIKEGVGPLDRVIASSASATVTERTPILEATKEFTICAKHKGDAQRSMLEFMMSERMDEAIADAQRPMLRQSTTTTMPQSTELQGESVTKVATIAGAANRPKRNPTQIKKMERTPQQLVDSGSVLEMPEQPVMDGDVEIGVLGGATSMDQLLDIIAPERRES